MFVGGFDLAAVDAVASGESEIAKPSRSLESALRTLIGKSLVYVVTGIMAIDGFSCWRPFVNSHWNN